MISTKFPLLHTARRRLLNEVEILYQVIHMRYKRNLTAFSTHTVAAKSKYLTIFRKEDFERKAILRAPPLARDSKCA